MTDDIGWIIERLLDRPHRRGDESNDEMQTRRQQERETAAAALTALTAARDAAKVRAEAAEGALVHEVKRSRRHLAQSTLDLVATLKGQKL